MNHPTTSHPPADNQEQKQGITTEPAARTFMQPSSDIMPASRQPALQPGPAWRRTAWGLWLTLLGLVLFTAAVAVLAVGVGNAIGRRFVDWPSDVTATATGLYVADILLDVIGRLLCMSGPRQLEKRRNIAWSLAALSMALILVMAGVWLFELRHEFACYLLLAAVVAQLSATWLFLAYLTEMTHILTRPDLEKYCQNAATIASRSLSFAVLCVLTLPAWGLAFVLPVPVAEVLGVLVLLFWAMVDLSAIPLLVIAFIASTAMGAYHALALAGVAREIDQQLSAAPSADTPAGLDADRY